MNLISESEMGFFVFVIGISLRGSIQVSERVQEYEREAREKGKGLWK